MIYFFLSIILFSIYYYYYGNCKTHNLCMVIIITVLSYNLIIINIYKRDFEKL